MPSNTTFLNSETAKKIDLLARDSLGISVLVLMENAGRAVAEEALRMMPKKAKIAVFCGQGNNGGDGLVAARHLLARGIKADIFLAGEIAEVTNEARTNLDILLKLREKITEVDDNSLAAITKKIPEYDLIIDALLGVGLRSRLRGVFKKLINAINNSNAEILAVDIPSGLDATSGQTLGCCIKADKTVTFVSKKQGMVIRQGPGVCGEILIRGLGIPLSSLAEINKQ